MARKASPARLVIALSIAAILAIFLLYTSIAGGQPVVQPSTLGKHTDTVTLGGTVLGPVRGGVDGGYRFRLRDVKGTQSVPVAYKSALPDLFRAGREVSLQGRVERGIFVGEPGSMVTKCPSKYSSKT